MTSGDAVFIQQDAAGSRADAANTSQGQPISIWGRGQFDSTLGNPRAVRAYSYNKLGLRESERYSTDRFLDPAFSKEYCSKDRLVTATLISVWPHV